VNGSQIAVVLFGLLSIAVCLWAVVVIIRSPRLRFKPLWLIGSLFGFAGLGLDWTRPDDLTLLFGISIPVVNVYELGATGPAIVKALFPVVAAIALAEARPPSAEQTPNEKSRD
jgi:hypothetical protein